MLQVLVAYPIIHYLINHFGWVKGSALIIPAFIVLNLALFTVYHGSLKRIVFLLKLHRGLRSAPAGAQIECRSINESNLAEVPEKFQKHIKRLESTPLEATWCEVRAVVFDANSRSEKYQSLFFSNWFKWPDGRRLVSGVRSKISKQLYVRTFLLLFVTLPLAAATLWFGLSVNWWGFLYFGLILLSQFLMVAYMPAWLASLLGIGEMVI